MKNILKYIVNVLRGNFSAELSDNPLSRTESDNVIELALNKDKKTPRAMTGFLLNKGAVKSWELILHTEQSYDQYFISTYTTL